MTITVGEATVDLRDADTGLPLWEMPADRNPAGIVCLL